MFAILVKLWPVLAGLAAMAGGLLFGWVKKKDADAKIAQAQTAEAQAKQQAAEVRRAADQANAAAAQAGEQVVIHRAQADQAAASLQPGQLDDELARLGALRKEEKP